MANRVPTDKVTENDVRELINILTLAASKWYELGLQLGIQDGLLKIIQKNHRNDCEAQLREMLMERLNQREPLTWGALVEALESESVRAHEVAERIRSQFSIPLPPVSVTQADVQSEASYTHCDTTSPLSLSSTAPQPSVSEVSQTSQLQQISHTPRIHHYLAVMNPALPPLNQPLATVSGAPGVVYPTAQSYSSEYQQNIHSRYHEPSIATESQGPSLIHLPAQGGHSFVDLQHTPQHPSVVLNKPYIIINTPTPQVSVTQSGTQVSPPPAKQPRPQSHTQPTSSQLFIDQTVQDTDEVTKKDIPELLNFLNPVASKCYHLGLQLGVDSADIDKIEKDYRKCKDQLREILKQRLKQEEPLTWAALIEALKSKSVDENRLAQDIRLHFLTPQPPVASAQPDKPSVSSVEHHNIPFSSPNLQWQSTCIQPESPVTQTTGSQSQVNTPPTRPHPQPTRHSVESEESHNDTPASFSSHQSIPPQLSTSLDQLQPLGTLSYTYQHSNQHLQQSSSVSQYIHEPLNQPLATAGQASGIMNPLAQRHGSEHLLQQRTHRHHDPSTATGSQGPAQGRQSSETFNQPYTHTHTEPFKQSLDTASQAPAQGGYNPDYLTQQHAHRYHEPSLARPNQAPGLTCPPAEGRSSSEHFIHQVMPHHLVAPQQSPWVPPQYHTYYQHSLFPQQSMLQQSHMQQYQYQPLPYHPLYTPYSYRPVLQVPAMHSGPQFNPPPAKQPRLQHQPHPQPTQHSATQPATNQTVQDSRSPLDQYIDYVKTVYKKSEVERDTHTVKWPPTPSEVYINLVSINRKISKGQMSEYNEVTKAMVQHGDIDIVRGKKWPIDFNEIAAGDPDPSQCLEQVVLVEGAPGVGKSTFAWEFCRRWERGEIAQQYQLVLLLRLRDGQMIKAKKMGDLIYHSSDAVHQAVVTHLEHSHGLNTLFILEGFDELSDAGRSENSMFLQLIHGKLLPHATVMVTSRPWAVEFLIKDYTNRISQHIEILGFTSTQISEYFSSVLSENEAKDLQAYIRCHPQLKGCMYIPLNTAIVVTVYQESQASGFPMPTTLTELYIALVQILILRYLKGHCLESHTNSSIRIFNISVPLEVRGHFVKLCHLAYRGIFGSHEIQLIFRESNLPEDFDNLGFMDSVTELYVTRGTVSSHNFLHLTFQEFLAAVHVSIMSSEQQLTHFQRHRNGRFKVVLRFLAGLTKLGCLLNGNEFVNPPKLTSSWSSLKLDSEVTADLVNWIFEAQSDEINEKLIGTGLVQFTSAKSLHAMDYYSLGYCIVHSQCQWLLDLKSITKEKAEMLVAGASDGPIGSSRVVVLELDSHFAVILDGLKKNVLNLQELSLSITERKCNILWSDLSSLRVLEINFQNLGYERGMEDIAKGLMSNQSLEGLIFNTKGPFLFTDAAVDYLAQFITTSNTLQYLGMHCSLFMYQGLKILAKMIHCNSKFPEKERRTLRICDEDAVIASPNMAGCSDILYPGNEPPLMLVVLDKGSETTEVTFDDVKDLDEVLRSYPNIGQYIHISLPTPVNVINLLSLAQVLHSNHMLQVKVALDVIDVRDIKELLKAYPNMWQCNVDLSVSGVTVNVSDLLQLAQVMHNNPTIHIMKGKLGVKIYNRRDIEGLDEVLRSCPNMEPYIYIYFHYLVNISNLLEVAQVMHNHPTLHIEGILRVKINNRRDTEGLDEVLRTYPNMKQYIDSCSVNVSDLPLLLHSNHIIPQVKVTVRICDGEDIKVVDEVLKDHPDMCKYISLSFPEHPTLRWENVWVINCLPSRVDKIKREYPDYIQNIDSIFLPP